MANTPLYKKLKNGTSFYCFASSAEDISSAYQNSNYKMYFSKFVLLNLPKRNLTAGTQSNKIYFDFEVFNKSVNATPPASFSDSIIESLRNYVANNEVVIKESRLNNTNYYYNTNELETTTEKIFFKWCKSLGIIDFEPATPEDEYFSNLDEFKRNNLTDDEYFPEYLWRERKVIPYNTTKYYQSGFGTYSNYMEIEMSSTTNFRIGDKIRIYNVSNSIIYSDTNMVGCDSSTGINKDVLYIIPASATQSQRIIINAATTLPLTLESNGQAELVYHKLVQYIGEITGVSNVQEANRNYTEVYANIPDHVGSTPDILFRTIVDSNYKPNLTFPILPSQYQPEIMGAELFSSPIVSSPQNYPGSYFGQFDTPDFTYETATGDSIRRSGYYFGVSGNINNPIINGSTIDGITIDFNNSHYVKMNIFNQILSNFDQFNALEVNNEPPSDFEYNAILWYYTVQKKDSSGAQITKNNLYGISFLDHPDNNPVESEIGIRFPIIKKLVSNGQQDGTSYAYSLNLNFNVLNDNPNLSYNPESINSLFSMNLFNQAMIKLSSTNDKFMNLLAEQDAIKEEVDYIKQLIYTQTDINVINEKINNLENLLRLYSTNQLVSNDSIEVVNNPGSPKTISLFNIEPNYNNIEYINTTNLYNASGIIPLNISVPNNKNFMIIINNNDTVNINMPNNDNLSLILDRDLGYKQTVEFQITADQLSTQNKKLDIYINSNVPSSTDTIPTTSEILLLGNIDLPIFYNTNTQIPNSAYLWKDFNFNIDFNKTIQYTSGNIIEIPLLCDVNIINNSIKPGDYLYLNNFYVGTSSIFDFSGQYLVDSLVSTTSSYIKLNVESNPDLVSYGTSSTLPLYIHGTNSSLLSNYPYFSLNKGKKILVTRISNDDNTPISSRYFISVEDIKY